VALRLDSPATTSPRSTGLLQVVTVGCEALAEAEPQALGLTHWFDAAPDGEPYTATVRFVGHRLGLTRKPGPRDSFVVSETVERVVPGSGRVAITARLLDVAPGEWRVAATLITPRRPGAAAPQSSPPPVSASGTTGFGPLIRARAPGAHLGAWPALVTIGVGVALTVEARLAARARLPVSATVGVAVIASVVGLLGARIYYLAEQERRLVVDPRALFTAGMCIQGFVLAAIGTATIGMLLVGASVGRFLDVTAPGLLFGMSIGRLGCFFGGCCAGRPTASRWGLWSSDRRIGIRRIPTQLLESVLALALGVVAWLAVQAGGVEPGGAVFAGAIAAYTLGRQLLLPLRDLRRKTYHGRMVTAILATAVVLADIAVVVFS
jgi:phosphatidylglycerol:prolipoprotein diacylglycerol transferase